MRECRIVGIVTALNGDVDLGRIERMLALAWESGAQPIVFLTKSDAAEHVADTVAAVQAIAPGCSVLAISAMTGDALDILTAMLDGTIVLIGPSGAGKSTLANALIGAEVLATNAVRTVDGKGRHTTVHRELFPLPSGGALIDTPGLRGIGLWDAADGIELSADRRRVHRGATRDRAQATARTANCVLVGTDRTAANIHATAWITKSPISETSTADLRATIHLQIGGELRKT